MPMTYHVDHGQMLIISEGHGVVSAKELCVYYDDMTDDTDLPDGYDILCDLTKVEKFDMDYSNISRVVRSTENSRRAKHIGRVAFLAESDVQYGIANMYAAMGLIEGGDFKVFRRAADATDWLMSARS